jgi:uncharacterized protein
MSIEIGHIHGLRVVKQVDFGFYLDGLNLGEILLPLKYVPGHLEIDDFIDVFIYLDSEDRPVATTQGPKASVGDCAFLEVVGQSDFGAFLDWGLEKDLLVPFKEQRTPMQVGNSYTVILYIDSTGRIAASSRLYRHLVKADEDGTFRLHEEVDLLIASRSDVGYRAVINGTHLGLIHNNDVYQQPTLGTRAKGYVKSIREDGRINLAMQPSAPEKRMELRGELSDRILEHLNNHEGHSPLTDKSPPEAIYKVFNVSKSNYKKALGKLYKEKKILIERDQIILLK